MLFNTLSFALFLPAVFAIYWTIGNKSIRLQNILLLVSSYFFYSCWDWRFLFLLMFSTFLDYGTGIKMEQSKTPAAKKFWFWLSIIINLGFLGVFKYYNFFAESFAEMMGGFGFTISPVMLNIILPVGISFYTFHGLSYVIDIYKGRIKAEKNIVDYSVFVSFFPLLVAGPIERATHLLPQIKAPRRFDFNNAANGMRQILWGLFKKVVIADQFAEFANIAFNNPGEHSGLSLLIGAICFAFQIYGDFSGYSDIALGTARLFGIELLKNFSYPYFSRDIAEFWRRWHISLSTWFRDYLYIPLGGSKGGTWMKVRNTFIIFLVSGFWHGANWTFIIWGLLNALYIMPSIILNTNRNNLNIVAENRALPTLKETGAMLLTFLLSVLAWIFFRAESVTVAIEYIGRIFSPDFGGLTFEIKPKFYVILLLFIILEWVGRRDNFAIENLAAKWPKPLRYTFYYVLIIAVIWFGGNEQQFIYFQF